jgi:type II secretory pathway pseudopilin PulG
VNIMPSAADVQRLHNRLQRDARPTPARGFTIVELVVVIASLAMLLCLLIPVVRDAHRQAERTACAGNLRQLGHSYHLYADAHKGKYPPISPGKWPIGNLGGPLGAETEPYGPAVLFKTGHMPDPSVVYCPNKGVGEELSYSA